MPQDEQICLKIVTRTELEELYKYSDRDKVLTVV